MDAPLRRAPTERELVRQATLTSLASPIASQSDTLKDPFRQERSLVLCFDGTSNEFQGDGTDTNVLKMYGMLNKDIPEQCKCLS